MAAAPTSYGYPKASIRANHLPIWQQPLARFTVEGANDWKVNPLPSIDRGIRVEAGTGSGDAVTDVFSDYETLQLPYPNTASRWYLVVRRRNWAGTGTTVLTAIPGSAEKVLPGRSDKPGEESDHPVALVRVTQKDTTVQEIIDLRVWAHDGGVEAADKLALGFLGRPGAAVKVGRSMYRFESKGNGVWDWVEYGPVRRGLLPAGGWNVQGTVTTEPDGGVTYVRASVQLKRLAADFRIVNSSGLTRLTDSIIPVGYRPSQPVDVVTGLTSSAGTWGGLLRVRVEANGAVSVQPITPTEQTIGKDAYFQFSAEWLA